MEIIYAVTIRILIGLLSLIFSTLLLKKYYAKRDVKKLSIFLFFLFFGFSWITNTLSVYSLNFSEEIAGNFKKASFGFMSLCSIAIFLFFGYFTFPKRIIYFYYTSAVLLIFYTAVIITHPIQYIRLDFVYNLEAKITMILGSASSIMTAFFFIFYSRDKTLKKEIRKKSFFYGTGIMLLMISNLFSALINNMIVSDLMKVGIIFGLFLLFFSEVEK